MIQPDRNCDWSWAVVADWCDDEDIIGADELRNSDLGVRGNLWNWEYCSGGGPGSGGGGAGSGGGSVGSGGGGVSDGGVGSIGSGSVGGSVGVGVGVGSVGGSVGSVGVGGY